MSAEAEFDTLAILWCEPKVRGDYVNWTLGFVLVNADGEPRNPDEYDYPGYPGLTITAQANVWTPARAGDGATYGWKLEYSQPWSVDLRRAESMVRTLRKAERGMTKTYAERGDTADFAEFVGRVATALGVKVGTWRLGGAASATYSDGTWRRMSVGELVNVIRHAEQQRITGATAASAEEMA